MTRANPYIGPKAFQRDDHYLFRGRDYEVQKLLNLLIAEQVLLLHAPSGAGKTSLINKAIIPKLEEKNFLVLPVMRVSRLLPKEILKQVEVKNRYVFSALLSLEKFREEGAEAYELTAIELARLKQLAGMSFHTYLKEVSTRETQKRVQAKATAAEPNQPSPENSKRIPSQIVLIFDQFEEILSLDPTDHDVKTDFFKQVGDALFTEDYWALFSMREDNAASLGSLVRQLPTRLETRFGLELLTTTTAAEAIKEPAQSQNVKFHEDTVQKLIDDLRMVKAQGLAGQTEEKQGEFVEPMQLQVVCYRLWEKLGLSQNENKKEITTADLKGTHVNEALAEFYEDCLRQVSQPGRKSEEEIRQWIEEELITPGETRGMVFMNQTAGEAAGMPKKIVEDLEGRHLLRGEYRAGAHWYELTHDRFIGPIKQSNRPWAALRIATRRAARAHTFAVLWFLGIALLWLFVEFFVTEPVRQSRIFAANDARITKEREALIERQNLLDSVLASLSANDQENVNNQEKANNQKKPNDQEKLATARKNISDARTKIINELKAVQPPKSRPGKQAKEQLEDLNKLQTALEESARINGTIAKIKEGSKNKWKDLSLTADEVAVLKSLVRLFEETGGRVDRDYLERRPERQAPPSLVVLSAATETRTDSPMPDLVKLRQGIASIDRAQGTRNWASLQLDVPAFEKAAKFVIEGNRSLVEDLKTSNDQRLAVVNEWNLSNRGLVVAVAPRAAEKLKVNFESNEDVQAALQQPEKEIDRSTRIRTYLTNLWDRTIPAERATAVVYLVWCVVLIAFMIYLTRAAVDLEERVGQFYDALSRVKAVSDPLGWNIKRRTPSILVMLALASLLLIHVRVSWLCFNVVRSPAGANWWGLLFIPAVLTVMTLAYYIVEHYRHGQIARARILELMSSLNALKALSLKALTNR